MKLLITVATSQLSAVIGAGTVTSAEHRPGSVVWLMSTGQVIVGSSSSVTVTVKAMLLMLPWMSVAVQVTVVTPISKKFPEEELQVTISIPQLSEAVGSVQVTTAPQTPGSLVWVMSAGMPLIVGASSSVTVTVKLAVVLVPLESVAV